MTLRKLSLAALGAVGLVGCTDTPTPPPIAEVTVAKVEPALPTPATTPILVAQQPQPKPVETVAKLPDDLGGKAVQKSSMPTLKMPAELPGPKAPRARTGEFDRGDLPESKFTIQMPSAPIPKGKPAKPSAPPERAPTDLGQAAAENLSGIKFAERPLVRADNPANAGAADVPTLARQVVERAPVDDPTAEISAAKVIQTIFPFPVGTLPFSKQSIPDPFEFAEQLKGKLPRDTEFGTSPTAVPPEKK